jgi:hypothetical protein
MRHPDGVSGRRNKMSYKGIVVLASVTLMASPAAAEQSAKARPATPEKTYCLQYSQDTGSRINRTECRTKKDWARIGVDIDELTRK